MTSTNYFMISNNFIGHPAATTLTHLEFRVMVALLRYSNSGKSVCYPSISLLAQECNASASGVKTALNTLQQHGFVTKIAKGNNLKGKSNRYKVAHLGIPAANASSTTSSAPASPIVTPPNTSVSAPSQQNTGASAGPSAVTTPQPSPVAQPSKAADPYGASIARSLKQAQGDSITVYLAGSHLKHPDVSCHSDWNDFEGWLDMQSQQDPKGKERLLQKLWKELQALAPAA
ncbi:helix-turn-helix domain-containing protein [Deinococcus yavapaiensis]|uniref:Helix-turn-helix protein n=1 Tax=Deinococcus yavapaiensis KR-236 TaxID=694435 RepID=A0A318SA83_9DEIO|nr:helix-turn-helix domain-containing protein [Deinococcus yavapaiensis]PYE55298.1 helix-turn-helix protein [Deinococcus yavapaiensis KR-236]